MRAYVGSIIYDTEDADKMMSTKATDPENILRSYEETLFRTKTGHYFLFGKGGPMSPYGEIVGKHCRSGGSKIIPLDPQDALEWLRRHDNGPITETCIAPLQPQQ
jgi:hypothetical protein